MSLPVCSWYFKEILIRQRCRVSRKGRGIGDKEDHHHTSLEQGHEITEERDVRRTGGGRGLRWGPGETFDGSSREALLTTPREMEAVKMRFVASQDRICLKNSPPVGHQAGFKTSFAFL